MKPKKHVIVAGGGVAGLESALALRSLAFDSVDVTLLTPARQFVYRPLAVGEPFGLGETARYDLEPIAADRRFELLRDAIDAVEPHEHRVRTQGGLTLDYDALVLAVGTRPQVALPGAIAFRGSQDAPRLAENLRLLGDGRPYTVAFVVPDAATWPLPLYELAILTARWAERESLPIDVMLATPERAPLQMFGTESSKRVARMLGEHGVRMRLGVTPHSVDDGRLWLALERSEPVDFAVALPSLAGPIILGLPYDPNGFVPVDQTGAVRGLHDVYAVGDMTDRVIKQGGLAAQQADVAAAAIARWAGSPVPVAPYKPVLRGVLITGGEPLYLGDPPDTLEWPPQKISGAYLSSFLSTHGHFRTPVAA
jgi:sulfide:quinone oxidoreductase